MALVLWPAMRHAGIRLHWNPDWHDPAVATVARLSAWTLGYVAANQVVFFVMITLVNSTGVGRVSAFTYAWQFFQLPYGLFTVSIMTTFTPELATHVTRNDLASYRRRFSQGLRLGSLLIVPTAVAYLVLARPAVSALLRVRTLQRGIGRSHHVRVAVARGRPARLRRLPVFDARLLRASRTPAHPSC